MNIGQALTYGQEQLAGSDSPYLHSRLLLEHITHYNHARLIAHPEDILNAEEESHYRQLIQKAAEKKPIPYLLGRAPFYGKMFYVNQDVLIPRQETESLVEEVLRWVRISFKDDQRLFVVDVGTGCGCIAITLAMELKTACFAAVDRSEKALFVARKNALRCGVQDRITFLSGSMLDPVVDNPALIVANLPYVADHEWNDLDDGVKQFEPELALRGGVDGLEAIGLLINQAQRRLIAGGGLFLEIGWKQGPMVMELARSRFPYAEIDIHTDINGFDRIIHIVAEK